MTDWKMPKRMAIKAIDSQNPQDPQTPFVSSMRLTPSLSDPSADGLVAEMPANHLSHWQTREPRRIETWLR
jgi:hypothetical protein